MKKLSEDEVLKASVVKLMRSLGVDLCDIKITIESPENIIEKIVLPKFLSDEFKKNFYMSV